MAKAKSEKKSPRQSFREQEDALRRDLLLRQTAEVLSVKGLRQFTMDEVAGEIGISKISFYRRFGSKEALVHTILERICERILAIQAGPWQGVGTRMRQTLQEARKDPGATLLLFRHATHDPEYRCYVEKIRNRIIKDTERSFLEAGADRHLCESELLLSAEANADLAITSLSNWLEHGNPEEDEIYIDWFAGTMAALYHHWSVVDDRPSPGVDLVVTNK